VTITENMQTNATNAGANAGASITISGKVTGGGISDTGVITVQGDGSATSVGTAVTITLSPSYLPADGKVLWSCTSAPAVHKFVPAECRH
jgi:hypothetical protein